MRCPGCDLYHPAQYDSCISCGTSLAGASEGATTTRTEERIAEGSEPQPEEPPRSKRRSKALKHESRAAVPTFVGITTALVILLVSAGATFFFLSRTPDEERMLHKGRDELSKGQYAFAVDTLNKATKANPNDPRAFLLLARAYVGIDKVDEAWKSIAKAQQLGKGVVAEPDLASDLANYYRLRKKYDKAIELLRPLASQGIKGKDAELADLDGMWGDEALSKGDLDTALKCWEEVKELRVGSRFPESEARLATIYEKLAKKYAAEKKDEEALSYLGKLTNIAQNPKHYEFAAEIYERGGKLELAINQLRKALELSNSARLQRELATLLNRRGKELLDKGQNSTGYAYLQQARSIDPSSAVPDVTLKNIKVSIHPASRMPRITGEVWNPNNKSVNTLSLRVELYNSKTLETLWDKEDKLVDEFVAPLRRHQTRKFDFVSPVRAPYNGTAEFKMFVNGVLYKAYKFQKRKPVETAEAPEEKPEPPVAATPPPPSIPVAPPINTTGSAPLPGATGGANQGTGMSPAERTLQDLDF